MPEQKNDPLPEDPQERAKVLVVARKAFDKFNVQELSDAEVETVLRGAWLEWEPKLRHVLAKTGQLEF